MYGSREQTPGFYNPVTHRLVDGKVERRPIEDAKRLLAEAGYPDGREAATGKPLVLNYDFQRAITPEFKSENDWMVKQFAKIGIQLEIRATDFNQFQDKTLKGKHQIFWAGWLADYPDAENFLFLLYGPNAKSKNNGENIANYENPRFDALFRELQYARGHSAQAAGHRRDGAIAAARRAVVVRLHLVGRRSRSSSGSTTASRAS